MSTTEVKSIREEKPSTSNGRTQGVCLLIQGFAMSLSGGALLIHSSHSSNHLLLAASLACFLAGAASCFFGGRAYSEGMSDESD